jgi:MFS family permease
MNLKPPLIKAAVAGALGGPLFGFDTAVISGTTHLLSVAFSLKPSTLGLTVSIALWGTVIGAMSAGVIGQRLGSRETLRVLGARLRSAGCPAVPFGPRVSIHSRYLLCASSILMICR